MMGQLDSKIDDAIVPLQDPPVGVPLHISWRSHVSLLMGGYQLLTGIVLAWFWLRSGLPHITNFYYFLSSVYSYEIVGPTMGVAAAMGLPALQLVLAVGLVTRRLEGGAMFLQRVAVGHLCGCPSVGSRAWTGNWLRLLRRF